MGVRRRADRGMIVDYVVRWTVTVDRPELRGPSFRPVAAGTKVPMTEHFADRASALRFGQQVLGPDWHFASEYVSSAHVSARHERGGLTRAPGSRDVMRSRAEAEASFGRPSRPYVEQRSAVGHESHHARGRREQREGNMAANMTKSRARVRLGKKALSAATRIASLAELGHDYDPDAFYSVKAGVIQVRHRRAGRGLGKATSLGRLPGFRKGLFYYVARGVVHARARK